MRGTLVIVKHGERPWHGLPCRLTLETGGWLAAGDLLWRQRERKTWAFVWISSPCLPRISGEFSRSQWAIKWHNAFSGRQAPVTCVNDCNSLTSRWPGISLCTASWAANTPGRKSFSLGPSPAPLFSVSLFQEARRRGYPCSGMVPNVRVNPSSFRPCLRKL